MKALAIAILCALAALSVHAADSSGATKQERLLIKEGNKLFEAKKYHEALQRYENALTLNPQSTVAQYNKAVTLVQLATDDNRGTQNDPRAQAAQLFQDIAQTGSRTDLAASSLYNLGNMAFNDEKYDQAIEMYKGSLRKVPESRRTRQNLLLAMKKKEEQEQNKDQNQDQDKQEQEQQQQQPQQQQQQQQQEQPKPMSQSAEQILQTMQNKENATRQKVNRREAQPAGRPATDKPW